MGLDKIRKLACCVLMYYYMYIGGSYTSCAPRGARAYYNIYTWRYVVAKLTSKQANIIKALQDGVPKARIVKDLGTTYATISRTSKVHADLLEQADTVKQVDINNWETDLSASLKRLTLHIANLLATRNVQRDSTKALMTTLAIAFDKLRLMEGKATNITTTNVNNMSKEQRAVLQELSDKYHAELRGRLKRVK